MRLEDIQINDFEEIYQILKNTFPTNELQPKERLYQAFLRDDFFGKKLVENHRIIAMITGYQQESYLFLEFFAVDKEKRGHGLGFDFLQTLLSNAHTPVYLEVELPEDELCQRRIGFYERLGFKLNTYDYQMPILAEGFGGCDLYVMSYPNSIQEKDFIHIKQDFFKNIYRV